MEDNLINLKGVGDKTIKFLNKNNLLSCMDIISLFPKKYIVYSVSDFDIENDNKVCVKASIISLIVYKKLNKSLDCIIFEARISSKRYKCIIFGKSYLRFSLKIGQDVILYGYYKKDNREIIVQKVFFDLFCERIEVSYGLKEITDNKMTNIIKKIYDNKELKFQENLPNDLVIKYRLLGKNDFYFKSHFPSNNNDILQIMRRKKYEDFFTFALSINFLKYQRIDKTKNIKDIDYNLVNSFIKQLPFSLTPDQQSAVNIVLDNMEKNITMNRLVQGDVGCGKTIVAIIASLGAVSAGYQVAIMAPTEILGHQHFLNFKKLLQNITIVELNSSMSISVKKEALELIKNGDAKIIIGTHALFQKSVIFNKLGLVVIDEQHRFGVLQRKTLLSKGDNVDSLYLTATPIPRTLGLTNFGDLDITSITTLPNGRIPIETKIIPESNLDFIFKTIKAHLQKKEQIYVVVPHVDSKNEMVWNINNTKELFISELGENNIGILHSKISKEDKEKTMRAFKENIINVLISTTVIEVGVDVANASVMVIMNSEMFGLSQLHQLRGRVGRGNLKSYCYLVTNDIDCKRLHILEQCNDGFELANKDFLLRGPGDFFGTAQSGFLLFDYDSPGKDENIWNCAKKDALEYYNLYNEGKFHSEFIEKIKKISLEKIKTIN